MLGLVSVVCFLSSQGRLSGILLVLPFWFRLRLDLRLSPSHTGPVHVCDLVLDYGLWSVDWFGSGLNYLSTLR